MGNHTKRTPAFTAEIESLIAGTMNKIWCGDKEGAGVNRIIEILRKNTTDSPCVVKAAEDEAIFVLRAKDTFSALLVMAWAKKFFDRLKGTKKKDNPKYVDAIECATEMTQYPGRKYPD